MSKAVNKGIRDVSFLVHHIRKRHPYKFLIVVFSKALVGLTQGAAIAVLVPILSLLTTGNPNPSQNVPMLEGIHYTLDRVGLGVSLGSLLLLVTLLALLESALKLFEQSFTRRLMGEFVAGLQVRLYEAYFNASWPFWIKRHSGQLAAYLTSEAIRVLTAFDQLNHFLSNCILTVVLVAVAFSLSFQFTLFFLIAGIVMMIVMKRFVMDSHTAGSAISAQNRMLHRTVHEHLRAAKLIKTAAMEESCRDVFAKTIIKLNDMEIRANTGRYWIEGAFAVFAVAFLCFGFYSAVVYLSIDMSKALVIMFMFFRLAGPMNAIQQTWHTLVLNAPAYVEMVRDLDDAKRSMESAAGHLKPVLEQGIECVDVAYGYNTDSSVLELKRLVIPAKQTVAIVGESGSGKSTLLDLVIGLIVPERGVVRIDGIPLTDVDARFWRGQIGYVGQDTVLFDDTVANNISWGCSNATQADIEEAARLAQAHEFISHLPQKYESTIGDRGVRLSGGERQRIALARALIRKPKLLILDEATSSLDSLSEKAVQEAIDSLKSHMTILMVAHRLSTIRNADWIYVIDHGRLVEEGPWEKLIEAGGPFYGLWSVQTA